MVNYNGSLFDNSEKVFNGNNRAFKFGDGLIETMRVINGKIPFYSYHAERLLRGMKVLKIQIPSYFNVHYLKNEISKVIENNEPARIRLSLWRGGGGAYRPTDNDPDFMVEIAPLIDKTFTLNEVGLTVGIYKDMKMRPTILSPFKTMNALPYVLASIYAKENSWDDILMLNTEGDITEAAYSNIFIIKEGKICTPPISSGCVGGVMRLIMMEIAQELEIDLKEQPLKVQEIMEAQEVFLTNAVQGIKWVENMDNQSFTNDLTMQLYERLVLKTKVISR
jgi:branched-chain amino acid aminotransferase